VDMTIVMLLSLSGVVSAVVIASSSFYSAIHI